MISRHHIILLIAVVINFVIMFFAIREVVRSNYSLIYKVLLIVLSIFFPILGFLLIKFILRNKVF
jgi:hypothetical protein